MYTCEKWTFKDAEGGDIIQRLWFLRSGNKLLISSKPDLGLTSLAAKGSYTTDTAAASASRSPSVANKSFGNFILLGNGDFISVKVECVCRLLP